MFFRLRFTYNTYNIKTVAHMFVLFCTNSRALLINSIRKERCIKKNSIVVLISHTHQRDSVFSLTYSYVHRIYTQVDSELFCLENAVEFRMGYKSLQSYF